MVDIQTHGQGVSFKIRVQPKAAKNQLAGIMDDALKVRLTAPPVDGAANKACVEFFADFFGVAKSQVEILTGFTGRTKLIKVNGLTKAEAAEKISSKVD